MEIVETAAGLEKAIGARRKAGESVGFVPTMGALHAGHASLVEQCRRQCGTAVVSIFVNPTQFNDPNDLHNYPRTPEADRAMLERAGADIVFMPGVDEMYPEPDIRVFDFGALDKVMEGEHRPGHFNGVAQVVSKLFDMVRPDKAYFGEKDFQQLAVIRAMVAQLGLKIEIVGCPIVRESDGLALSSRNMLLTPGQRRAAPLIHKTLCEAREMAGTKTVGEVTDYVLSTLAAHPLMEPEYFLLVDSDTLQPVGSFGHNGGIRACVTVRLGNVRLIDNMKIR